MTLNGRHFGYRPDPPDTRDRLHMRPPGLTRVSEVRMDLLCGPVRDQGNTSSCVGHACVEAIELLRALEGAPGLRLSPAHAYWLARARDGLQHEDGGAFIRSAISALRKVGCCGETDWPLKSAHINERPPMSAELSGVRFADITYERVIFGADAVLDALQLGHPVVIGMQVGNVFMDAFGDDTIPAPSATEVMIGGHAVLVCGQDRSGERIRILNSWGRGWGSNGLAWLESEWLDRPTTGDAWALVPRAPANGGA